MYRNITQEGIEQAELMEGLNLAESLDKEVLDKIASDVNAAWEEDYTSATDWRDMMNRWKELATQRIQKKNEPWKDASNVKFPLLTVAAMQFHARSFSASVSGPQPIKAKLYKGRGQVEEQDKEKCTSVAEAISRYMSQQVTSDIPNWMDGHDRLCSTLPVVGSMVKKTYFDYSKNKIVSRLVDFNDFAMDYYATDFDTCRKTERILMPKNDLVERVRSGQYLDIDFEKLNFDKVNSRNETDDKIQGRQPTTGVSKMIELLECHCYYDLDGDGYEEPYIIVVEKDTQNVFAVHARWDADESVFDEEGDPIRLEPVEYYTNYGFIPDPGSNVYFMGFGALLGPTNEAVNTIINQLVDAGTLSNLQGGFLGRGIRTKNGIMRFKPGEWKSLPSTGDDIRKNIYPLPVKEPSSTLFNLLGLLIDGGERIGSISDLMVGESPGQNQPFATTQAVLEQGLKVFTSIYKRLHRSLASEYEKIYRLNAIYLDRDNHVDPTTQEVYALSRQDFTEYDHVIQPSSDPDIVTDTQKIMKADMLKEKVAMGMPLNIMEVNRRILEAEGHENISTLMDTSNVPADPEAEMKKAEFQHRIQMDQADLQLRAAEVEAGILKDKAQAMVNMAKAEGVNVDNQLKVLMAQLDKFDRQEKSVMSKVDAAMQIIKQFSDTKIQSDKNTIAAEKVKQDGRKESSGRSEA